MMLIPYLPLIIVHLNFLIAYLTLNIMSKYILTTSTGFDKQNFQCKNVNILLPIILAYLFGAQKNRLIETVLFSTHNICFGWK